MNRRGVMNGNFIKTEKRLPRLPDTFWIVCADVTVGWDRMNSLLDSEWDA
jgi:hypothetical protein